MSVVRTHLTTSLQSAAALLGFVFLALAPCAIGANIADGKTIYNTTCFACHGTDPKKNENAIRNGADNPNLILAQFSSNPAMQYLQGQYTTAQVNDVAAYIGSVINPGGGSPILTLTPASLAFAAQTVSTTNPGQTVTLANTGTGNLSLTGVSISPTDYSLLSGCSGVLAPNNICQISVTFTPHSVGSILGSLTFTTNANPSALVLPITGCGVTTGSSGCGPPLAAGVSVIEYYNAHDDLFFITANPAEATWIDAGNANLGASTWARTGGAFNAYPSPGAGNDVCRFYDSAIPPVGIHFYTANAAECANVKASLPAWGYEGIAFNIPLPTAGVCPSGTTPVYRYFDNRANESWRFTTNTGVASAMLAKGWVAEGVQMCAPQ